VLFFCFTVTTVIKQLAFLCLALCLSASVATAEIITIQFEADPSGPAPNGFMSADSPLVSFHDSFGADLQIGNFGAASIGQGLLVGGDDSDGSFLVMQFGMLVDSLSMDLGGDNPASEFTVAALTLYLNDVKVGFADITMNGDGAMNDHISFAGTFFNSATLDFYDGNGSPPEIVDNIQFNTVPAPSVLALLLMTACAIRLRRRCQP
jgi:hypothetical protein